MMHPASTQENVSITFLELLSVIENKDLWPETTLAQWPGQWSSIAPATDVSKLENWPQS